MARYDVPQNIGKVRVAMGMGGKYTVWNGKHGKNEFVVICRNRKEAEAIVKRINARDHGGEIVVD